MRDLMLWCKTGSFDVLETEVDVMYQSSTINYHGILDAIALHRKTGELCVLDFKNKPKRVGFDTAMQLAAYQKAYNWSMAYSLTKGKQTTSSSSTTTDNNSPPGIIIPTVKKGFVIQIIDSDDDKLQTIQIREREITNMEHAFLAFSIRYSEFVLNQALRNTVTKKNDYSEDWFLS
jgi:hypothetical protein